MRIVQTPLGFAGRLSDIIRIAVSLFSSLAGSVKRRT